jgi:hypothetical protein
MTDVVVKVPVREGEEARLFGHFLSSFVQSSADEADRWGAANDAPYLMVRSEPQPGLELKVLIFQQRGAALAFSRGWDNLRMGRSAEPQTLRA